MVRFLLVIAVLAALVVGGYPWIDRHLPPGYRPFAPLSVDDPPTWVTRMKLKRIKQDPAACMALLTQAQAAGRITFRQQRSSEGDCPLDNPVRVTRFGPVALSASFLASCPLALSSTMFVGQAAAPEAQTLLGKRLVRIDHVGSFACRNIYHRAEGRRSEHASADALDVAAFRFSDGSRLTIGGDYRRQNDGGQYLRTLFSASCAYYGNALGPDYNAAHASHFHLGMRGFGLCR
ncbi:Extensin family protein [Sodalis praecaptivus]|uniref:Extensin family protein n=1 Tax=Sodalis praecaptivus TaxID=1239307 RepID=W0HZX7_9GAMM|nr:extensin family protein [Sodalis praecaptivus]AHF78062.1 Extensin family protein [Sodalis praecaptivus]